jgi:transaldolase
VKIFLDTANIVEIKKWHELGLVDGITTNPSIIAKDGRDFLDIIKEIAEIIPGPISAEVIATDYLEMLTEGRKLSNIAKNIVVKLPLTFDGLKASKALRQEGIEVNVTLCFSANQAFLAAKCGASYISPFIGRLEDIGEAGIRLIEDIRLVYQNYQMPTKIIVASIRSPYHVTAAAKLGADIVTISPYIMQQMLAHPLTTQGLEKFLADWQLSGKKI